MWEPSMNQIKFLFTQIQTLSPHMHAPQAERICWFCMEKTQWIIIGNLTYSWWKDSLNQRIWGQFRNMRYFGGQWSDPRLFSLACCHAPWTPCVRIAVTAALMMDLNGGGISQVFYMSIKIVLFLFQLVMALSLSRSLSVCNKVGPLIIVILWATLLTLFPLIMFLGIAVSVDAHYLSTYYWILDTIPFEKHWSSWRCFPQSWWVSRLVTENLMTHHGETKNLGDNDVGTHYIYQQTLFNTIHSPPLRSIEVL